MDPRSHPFYHGDDNKNVALLEEILMTYVMYNFDLGYVQVKHCVLCNICVGGGGGIIPTLKVCLSISPPIGL